MDDRVLVTTAIEESWPPESKPVLFLGEWCRRHSRRSVWQKYDHNVLPYHSADPDNVENSHWYLKDRYEEILSALSLQLNSIHNVEHDPRYWRILVGPWLSKLIHVLFDRYESVRLLAGQRLSGSILLAGTENLPPPTDTVSFVNLYHKDFWNHGVYGRLLQHLGILKSLPVSELSIDSPTRTEISEYYDNESVTGQNPPSTIHRAFGIYNRFAVRLTRRTDAVMYLTYLHPSEEFRLCARLRQVPCTRPSLPRPVPIDVGPSMLDSDFRNWRLPVDEQDLFQKVVALELPRNVPTAFLEGYGDLRAQMSALPLPAKPRAIWTSNAHYSDDVFNAWVGQKVEEGCPYVVGQHGGFYGLARFSIWEDHDREISDVSMTWGWSEDDGHSYAPVGHFIRPHRPLAVDHASKLSGVLVTQTVPPMGNEATANVAGSQWLEYFEFHCQFLEALPEEIRQAFIIRTAAPDVGWDEVERWHSRMPNMAVNDGNGKLKHLLREARLCVATWNGTVFQESFLMQVPTIVVWNPIYFPLRDSAQSVFDVLEDAGIFHPNPLSAAHHVTSIWDDTETWWTSEKVRSAVEHFNGCYNWGAEGIVSRLKTAIEEAPVHGASPPR